MDPAFFKLSPIPSNNSSTSSVVSDSGGLQTSQSAFGSVSGSTPPTISSPELGTHDTARAKYHIKNVKEFAQTLETAARRAFPNRERTNYKDVQVLLLRWEEDELEVKWELDDLAKVFQDYGFKTEKWLIPTESPLIKIMGKAVKFVEEYQSEDTLFILYYGGHAQINRARQATWSCKRNLNYSSFEWGGCQGLFEQSKSDTLILLDCCSAAAAAPSVSCRTSSITETIAACGWETWAPEPGRHSFTNALIEVLEDWLGRQPFSAAMLHSEVLSVLKQPRPKKNKEISKTPVYIVNTLNPKAHSIEIARRRNSSQPLDNPKTDLLEVSDVSRPSASPAVPTATQDKFDLSSLPAKLPDKSFALPHVIMSIALEEDQLLDTDTFIHWLKDFPALASYAKIQGVYRSFSTLILLSVPVIVWDLLPDHPAWNFVGYAASNNLFAGMSLETGKFDLLPAENNGSQPKVSKREALGSSAEPNPTRVPEFPVMELIPAIANCRDTYAAATDEYASAPSTMKELFDTCEYLGVILEDFKSVLGDTYLQWISFGRGLTEFYAFVQKYRFIKKEYFTSRNGTPITTNIHQAWEKEWETGHFAMGGSRARNLKHALSLEIRTLVIFILVFALKRTVSFNRSTSLTHRRPRISRPHSHEANKFRGIFARLQSVRYRYERQLNTAVQHKRAANLEHLYKELESAWHALCVRAGLIPKNGQAPSLQTERLLVTPSQNMNELLVNLSSPSTHSALRAWPNAQLPLWSRTSSASHSGSTFSSLTIKPVSPTEDPAILRSKWPEFYRPASPLDFSGLLMPNHIATIMLPFQRTRRIMLLRRWESHGSGDTHKIVWTGENAAQSLEHYIPPNTFPDTQYSFNEKKLHVSFSEAHHIEWKFEDGIPNKQHCFVGYDFLEPGPLEEFQEDIRGKFLVVTFESEQILYRRSAKDNDEAVRGDLKIWKDKRHPYHYSLSFLIFTRRRKDLEFPLLWFHTPIKREANKSTTVCIEFVRGKESGSAKSVTPRPPSRLQLVASFRKSQSTPKGRVLSTMKRSVSSENSRHAKQADIANEFKSLEITFSTKEDADVFVNIFDYAHIDDNLPPKFQNPWSDVEGSLGLGLDESHVLGPFQSTSSAPSPQSSTAGASASFQSTGISSIGRSSASHSATQTSTSQSSMSSFSSQPPKFEF